MSEAVADKVDPFIYVDFLGEQRKVEYTLRSAKLFNRLVKASLLDGYDVDNPDHIVAFILSGLVEHNRTFVGDCDKIGTPNETMGNLINRIDSLSFKTEIWQLLKQFGVAVKLAQPEAEPGNAPTAPAPAAAAGVS